MGKDKPHTDHPEYSPQVLDVGELLYIREVKIKPALRKKGLACLALKQLLRKLSQRHKENTPNSEWWFAGECACQMLQLCMSLQSCCTQ